MLKFTKNFSGSYKSETTIGTFYVETHKQYTSQDDGKGWVMSLIGDFDGDNTVFCNTKKEAIEAANTAYQSIV